MKRGESPPPAHKRLVNNIHDTSVCVPLDDAASTNRNILVYNSNKMHKSQSLFYLTTALHVSGVTVTNLQEHETTVTTASGNRYTVLLSVAIVEELELV